SWEVPTSDLRLTSRISVALEEQSRAQERIAGRRSGEWLNLWRLPRVWAGALAAVAVVLLVMVPSRQHERLSITAMSNPAPTSQIAQDTNGAYSRDRAVQAQKKPQEAITTDGTRKDKAADDYSSSSGIVAGAVSPAAPPPPSAPKAVAPSRGQSYGTAGKLTSEPRAEKAGDAVANSAPMV